MTAKWPRLLIVDDDPAVGFWITRFLKRYFESEADDEKHPGLLGINGEIVDCRDGNTALRLLREEGPFALIVTDLAMTPMTGLDLVTRIRSGETEAGNNGTPKTVLVVACSGAFDSDELNYPPYSQFNSAVRKPLEPGRLVMSLLKLLFPLDSAGVLSKKLTRVTIDEVSFPDMRGEHDDVQLRISDASFIRINETGQTGYLEWDLPRTLVDQVFRKRRNRPDEHDWIASDGRVLHRTSCVVSYSGSRSSRIEIELPEQQCFRCRDLTASQEREVRTALTEAIRKALGTVELEHLDADVVEFGFVLPS